MAAHSSGRSCGHQSYRSALSLTTLIFLTAALVSKAQTTSTVALLRNKALPLLPPNQIPVPPPIDDGDGKGNGTGTGNVPIGMDVNGRRTYVVRSSEADLEALRDTLVSKGVSVQEVIAQNTLQVFGLPGAVVSSAQRYGALVAEYGANFKISPETENLLRGVAPITAGRRRALQAAGPGEDGGPAVVSNTLRRVSDATATVLGSLLTWDMYDIPGKGAAPRDGGPDDRLSPPPPPSFAASAPPLYGVNARLVQGLQLDYLTAQVARWRSALPGILGRSPNGPCAPRVVDSGLASSFSTNILVFMCAEDIDTGVGWLSSTALVLWVEPMLRTESSNAVASVVLQTGNLNATQYTSPLTAVRPYWNADIRGEGVIVGVDDTGLDLSHCAFIDDKFRPGSLRAYLSGNPLRLFMPTHRKVVQYVLPESAGAGWFGDQNSGHGTHVSGSVAGAVLDGAGGLVMDPGTGSAPFARLSVFDTSFPNMTGVYLPMPIDDKILAYHYSAGSRLSTDSWTQPMGMATAYMEYARQFDAFAWRNPDFLSVVAAGNNGFNGQTTTVTSPGTAKNVLTVGASLATVKLSALSATADPGFINRVFLFRYSQNGARQSFALWPRRGTSLTNWQRLMNNTEVPVRMASPEHACTPLIGSSYTGTVVLVDTLVSGAGTNCTLAERGGNVWARGAVAVLFIADSESVFVEEVAISNTPNTIAYGYTNRAAGMAARSFARNLNTSSTMICTNYAPGQPGRDMGIDTIASFSGAGPLKDGRIKPDIVAPGSAPGIVSADSSNYPYGGVGVDAKGGTCSSKTVRFQGTSMATPLVAGHLALMRQYFRDGFYPMGNKNDAILSVPFEPSGMLLKALAIVGAESLAGGFTLSGGRTLGAAPDGYQGWGRLDLAGALPLAGFTAPNVRMQVADYGVIANGEMVWLRGLKATGTGPINAVLVWYDYPANGASAKDLVNDLDFGFQINNRNASMITYNQTRPDSVNTVERIELTGLRNGDLVNFVVHGRDIRHHLLTTADARLPQRWAVVVVGHFIGTLRTQHNPSWLTPNRVLTDANTTAPMVFQVQNSATFTSLRNGTLVVNFNISQPAFSVMTVTEVPDPTSGFYFYTIQDSTSRCMTIRTNTTGSRVTFETCNRASNQKWAFFRNRMIQDGSYLMTAQSLMGSRPEDRRCIKTWTYGSVTGLGILPCNEEDAWQGMRISRSTRVVSPPPVASPPASPAPPSPAPLSTDSPGYPYPLTFRLDFYPVGGNGNDYDYDYANSEPTDYYRPLSDVDLTVSWMWGNTTYQVTPDNYAIAPSTGTGGAVHGGDNTLLYTMFEIVHFQTGMTPPMTLYHVCAAWKETETPSIKAVATVFRGNPVASASKVFDTSAQLSYTTPCNPSSPGYIFSYNLTNAPAAPPPPTPSPPPLAYPHSLAFRADWTVLGGMLARESRVVDLDIVVGFRYLGVYKEVGFYMTRNMGGFYAGDNKDSNSMVAGQNYELIFWPEDIQPPSVAYDVCVRWYGFAKPLAQVTLSVFFQSQLVQTNTSIVDATLPRYTACNSSAVGYLGSFDLSWMPRAPPRAPPAAPSSPPSAPPPPPVRSPNPPPSPPLPPLPSPPDACGSSAPSSSLFGLAFRTLWFQQITGPSNDVIYDWDMIVAWSFGGSSFELAQYNRFVAGGVHGGDNINIANKTNGEVAFWPTGVTGQQPQLADYHVCVRWYQAAILNVTLTVSVGTQVVKTTSTVWSSSSVVSKVCAPGVAGYIGSYTYTGANRTGASGGSSSVWASGQTSSLTQKAAAEVITANAAAIGDLEPISTTAMATTAATAATTSGGSGGGSGSGSSGGSGSTAAGAAVTNSGVEGSDGGSGSGSGGDKPNIAAIAAGSAVGGAALLAVVAVAAVQWRRARVRTTRVVAM